MGGHRVLVPDSPLIPGGVETVVRSLLPRVAERVDRLGYLIPEFRIDGLRGRFPANVRLIPWLKPGSTATGLLQRLAARFPRGSGDGFRARMDEVRIAQEFRGIGGTHLFYVCIYDQPPPPPCGPSAGYLFDLNYRHFGETRYDETLRAWNRSADHILFSSRSVEREFEAAFPRARASHSVVPLGANPPQAAEPDRASAGGIPLFLCPATFARHKGQLALLRAVAELLADGKKIRVVLTGGGTDRIAGETPETDPRLEAVRCFYREHRASLEGAVELLGYCPVERVASLFREASAVVLPSEYEGFGLPLIEAASYGVPVLCTGIGPFVEQIERHDLGSVVRRFEPGDHRALAREMADVAEGRGPRRLPREELAAKLGKWTWDDCADAVVRVLDGIGRHRGNAGGRG